MYSHTHTHTHVRVHVLFDVQRGATLAPSLSAEQLADARAAAAYLGHWWQRAHETGMDGLVVDAAAEAERWRSLLAELEDARRGVPGAAAAAEARRGLRELRRARLRERLWSAARAASERLQGAERMQSPLEMLSADGKAGGAARLARLTQTRQPL